MCGIAGWVCMDGATPPDRATLVRMAAAITHRGPDEEGFHFADGAALAARRLSIVDLAGGHQPIGNEDGSVWVTYNGEIYNHADLRADLTARGHRFATRCDTEVLVHLYEEYGVELLSRLEGQWSFAIWDARRRRLFAARDRLGVRPLYYARRNGLFLFASEVKALLASGLLPARLDVRGLDHVCHFLCLIHDRTLFEGVTALPPGHFLLADADRVGVHEYWDLSYPTADEDRAVEPIEMRQLTRKLEQHLVRSVDRRLRADVPIVSYLSGGVDSALITALAHRRATAPTPTFTATFRQRKLNEGHDVRHFSAAIGNHATYVDCHPDRLARAFPHVIYHAESPVMDTASAATFLLSRAVRDAGYKVVLSGEGADESIAGYVQFKLHKISRAFDRGPLSALRPLVGALSHRALGTHVFCPPPEQTALANRIFGCVPDRWGEFWFLRRLRHLFSADVRHQLGGYEAWDDVPATWRQRVAGLHPLNQSLYLAYKVRLAGSLLSEKGDRMSMANSVEGRHPFLDTDYVQFCARLPTSLKLNGLTEKYLLRRVAARYMPATAAWRRKKMFIAPYSETILSPRSPLGRDLLSPEAIRRAGLFDPTAVANLLQAAERIVPSTPSGVLTDLGVVFTAGVQLWHRIFVEGQSAADLAA